MATTTETTDATQGTQTGTEHPSSGVFPPMDTTKYPSQLLWLAIFFGLLYFLMTRILPKIGSILEGRKAKIDGDLARAQALKDETEAAVKSYEKALADARAKANDIARDTREAVTRDIDARQAEINASLSRKIDEAEARISAAKANAMRSVGDIATESAAEIVAALGGGTASRATIERALKG